jgi:hypothetical protein
LRLGGKFPEHAHLVSFALTFLEEHAIRRRSGLMKSDPARGLEQAKRTETKIVRPIPKLPLAVPSGRGPEEVEAISGPAKKARPLDLQARLEGNSRILKSGCAGTARRRYRSDSCIAGSSHPR